MRCKCRPLQHATHFPSSNHQINLLDQMGQLFSTSRSQLWLYSCVAINGAIFAFFGLVQRLTWNGRMYWIGPEPGSESVFAAFVSRNSGGAYLNMCLAAALEQFSAP